LWLVNSIGKLIWADFSRKYKARGESIKIACEYEREREREREREVYHKAKEKSREK
jgi:hypothetical protein